MAILRWQQPCLGFSTPPARLGGETGFDGRQRQQDSETRSSLFTNDFNYTAHEMTDSARDGEADPET